MLFTRDSAPSPLRVVVGSDHVGLELKHALAAALEAEGIEVVDVGTYTADRVDYPRIAQLVASRITPGTFGLLVCGTGAGMQISANRNRFVRAVVIHDVLTAKMARAHNDANVACFGSRVTAPELAIELLAVFLQTPFAGGRHADRVAMLSAPAGTEELA